MKKDDAKRKRAGRLKLPDVRDKVVMVRLNDEELQQIDAWAFEADMRRGELFRCALFGKKINPKKKIVPEINKQAWAELAIIGNNLNQIAKILNKKSLENPGFDYGIEEIKAVRSLILTAREKVAGLDES